MRKTFNIYGLSGIIQLIYFKVRTFFLFPKAKIVRFPIRIRGKKFIKVGHNFTTGFNCRLDAFSESNKNETLIEIGNNVQINDYVHIGAIEKIEIHDSVLIASKVFITDHNHGSYTGKNADSPLTSPSSRPLHSSKVVIEKNVWIGEFVSILPGVRIGEGSIIGSMSVVNKDIPPFSIAVGSPAKIIKQYDFNKNEWIKIL
ncbi:lipopolysaccharide O-acetyltransferase [Flavobacterium arsenatis]|uniref:Lipopolysaccharide O-acetyltransferase n=1 Tax=Flavobacterium arsenatis TaxID=1484332 RepID=A0ABU1TQN3_9FLAO|nr:acetyltransferase [Flavobacterium arsenatis]MDR6968290.1 lipopolysaccharide O-acetyltransferase [Flavobacterium arsenatis]